MVMAESQAKGSKLLSFVAKNVDKICVFSYVLGVVGFLALPYREFSENHYHSENALLTGLQQPKFGWKQVKGAEHLNNMISEIEKTDGMSAVHDYLVQSMQQSGMNAYKQTFTVQSPLPKTVDGNLVYQTNNGTNVYGFIRAGRAASTESMVLNIPISKDSYNYAIGLALSFGKQIRSQPYWAKDVVLLFTEMGYVGAQAWLQSYYDTKNSDFIKSSPLQERAGAILAAINLELPVVVGYLNAEVVGNNGQLPNLDLFNVLTKLCRRDGVRLSIGGVLGAARHDMNPVKSYKDSLRTVAKMISKQAKGFSDINHAMFLQYNIQSLTIQGVTSKRYGPLDEMIIGRVVEGIFRSLNNLLEKLHHSYFFYLISATDRFISIVLYMPPFGLILLGPTLKALCLWLKITQDKESEEEEQESTKDEDEVNESIEDLIKEEKTDTEEGESAWMELFYILAVTHLLGVGLYFSPKFAPLWSAMYSLTAEDSLVLIFLSTYAVASTIPFSYFSRFCQDVAVLDLLRVMALVLYAVILGCTAVMNFSLGMMTAVLTVPLITPINSHWKRLRPIYIIMAFLASPMMVASILNCINQYVFNAKMESLWNSTKNILKTPYEQSMLGNSWNYEFACLLLYPNWMLFWFLAVSQSKEHL